MSAEFIYENADVLDMKLISKHQSLDIGAIKALKDKLDMQTVFQYQELMDQFVLEHVHELEAEEDICSALVLNQNISHAVVNVIFRRWVLQFMRKICQRLETPENL